MIEILNAESRAGEVQMLWPITLCALDIIGRGFYNNKNWLCCKNHDIYKNKVGKVPEEL